jgi:Tfp pilus assembly protein PilF
LGARQRLVREAGEVQADGRFLTRYQFAHALYQSYLYNGLGAGERRLLHREVGAALETLYGEQKEIVPRLAYHYGAAGDEERERRYAWLAGKQAAVRYANAEALHYLTRALELTSHTDAALTERWELLLAREEVNQWWGDRAAQVADLDALERLAERMDDDQRAARQAEIALYRALLVERIGDYAGACALAESAVRLARQAGDTIREARGYWRWGVNLNNQGEFADARSKFELGLALAQAAGHRGLQADCLRGLGYVCRNEWNLTEGEAYLGQALSIARERGDRHSDAAALWNLSALAYFRLDRVAAEDYGLQALRIFQETGYRHYETLAANLLGALHLRYGDHARAQAYLEHGLQMGRESASWPLVSFSLLFLSIRYQHAGDFERSRRYALKALRLCRKLNPKDSVAGENYQAGFSLYCQGEYSAAAPYLQQTVDLVRVGGWQDTQRCGLTGVGLNALAQGDYGAARDALADSRRLLRDFPEQDPFARDDEAYAQSALALLHHQLGEDERAEHYARRALEIHRRTFGPERPALALTRLGHAMVGLGKLEDGRAAYQEALDLRRELGQAHLATEPLAGLARVALAQGDLAGAKTCVDEILSHLEKGTPGSGAGHPLDGTDEPLRILLTCYQVLRAFGNSRADEVLAEAYRLLQERAAKIDDKALRRSYLENVRANREILREWNAVDRRSLRRRE